jgi:non-specific serine/threonine protein kinase
LLETGELFTSLKLSAENAHKMLRETPLYEEYGISCRVPEFWRTQDSLRVKVAIGGHEPVGLGINALIAFHSELKLGELDLTEDEIRQLLNLHEGLSKQKGTWIEIDHTRIRQVLSLYDLVRDQREISFADAMRLQLGLNSPLTLEEEGLMEVTAGEWLTNFRQNLLQPDQRREVPVGDGFHGQLRVYQQEGVNWLNVMRAFGFGALLADDMGLGKTVQILAFLEYMRITSPGKTLLVIPASLLHNWQQEANRFAPNIKYKVVHTLQKDWSIEQADLFITTYGMTTRLASLREPFWDVLILDEAQAIKNTNNKQTKAINQMLAHTKIAMTGTPIENRLSDLWSIFNFLNPGLLGTEREFGRFTKSLSDQPEGYQRLRNTVSPFILRRLKTDKSIIEDLPEKVEVSAYADLTPKQAFLYNQLLKDLTEMLKRTDDMSRRGAVLASLIKFKQICNHPDHYLGGGNFESKYSGKFQKLMELGEVIREKRERVLVFTQFQEMTKPLRNFLSEIFQQDGLVLDGKTPVRKRGELIETFNSEKYTPFMVLSLKAGGIGLNLTAANHVIHFDRWWNPAVERQATDRSYRIGQKKNVMVHKFITTGTVEEKIEQILQDKQFLADELIIQSSDSWITEMSDNEILNLFSLSNPLGDGTNPPARRGRKPRAK